MRLVGAPLLDAFPNAILNIHPSLLPAFPGVDAQRQALEHGVKVSRRDRPPRDAGARRGPIVLQATVPVRDDDTPETLSARILIEEHRLYPEAVRILLDGGWTVEGRRFVRATARSRLAIRRDVRRERQDRDFGRTVDPHRHVDRADAATDERRRVLAAAEAGDDRKVRAATAPSPGSTTWPPCVWPLSISGIASAAASVSRVGVCARSIDRRRRAARHPRRSRQPAASSSGCR